MKNKIKWKIIKKTIVNSNKTTNILIAFFSIIVLIISISLGIASIKKKEFPNIPGKSSFALAIAAPRNANFVKYISSLQIASTFTTGLFTPPPPTKLYETLQLPKLTLNSFKTVNNINEKGSIIDIFGAEEISGITMASRTFTRFWSYAYPGMAEFSRSAAGKNISGALYADDLSSILIMVRNNAKWWSWKQTINGETKTVSDPVKARDFVQTLKYILNLSVGSEWLVRVLDWGLKNTDSCNVEQEEYIKTSSDGLALANPFGYFWSEEKQILAEARLKGDAEYNSARDRIKRVNDKAKQYTPACRSLFLDLPVERINEYDLTNSDQVHELQELINNAGLIFSDDKNFLYYKFGTKKANIGDLILSARFSDHVHFFPSNKKFIDSVGGINKYGLDKETIIGNGTHKVDNIIFGNLGFAYLTPDSNYWDYKNMLTGNVKLIFNQEPYALDALFQDNKIAKTRVTRKTLEVFYNSKKYRPYLRKLTGYGTFGFTLNISQTGGKPLDDPDLRRALYYIMNRNQARKIANWDSTYPVTTFTAFKQTGGLTSYRAAIEIYQDSEVVNTEAPAASGGKNIPLRTVTYLEQSTKSNELESLPKKDKSFLPKVAKFYLDRYKKNHANQNNVKLTFLYDTSAVHTERMYILLDSLVRKYFGDYIILEPKGVPSNFYLSLKTTGKFDITPETVEPASGSGLLSYFKYFFWTDELSNEIGEKKLSGYKINISGGFTFKNWFDSLSSTQEQDIRQRLNISESVWEYIKFMTRPIRSTNPEYDEGYLGKGLVNWKRRIREIEAIQLNKEKLDTYLEINDQVKNFVINYESVKIELTAAFEKILRETVPVIPIMEVDTFWIAVKLYAEQAYNTVLAFVFPYLCNEKPLAILPGCDSITAG